jgi:hypothetical protein
VPDSVHCYTPSWCRCPDEPRCQLCKQGRCPVDSARPAEGAQPVVSAATVVLSVKRLAYHLCTVQGNDHYDTDYAPCSGCREIAEAIAEAESD